MSKMEDNIKVGRLYYQALNDAAGYPNGMAYWPDMASKDKYYYTVTALDFLKMVEQQGFITINKPLGLGEKATWGEGECKELMDQFEVTREKELEEFNQRLEALQKRLDKQR
jgi:hypothetical protein